MGNTTLTTSRALTRVPEEPGRAPRVTRLLCPWVAEPANRWDLGNHHLVPRPRPALRSVGEIEARRGRSRRGAWSPPPWPRRLLASHAAAGRDLAACSTLARPRLSGPSPPSARVLQRPVGSARGWFPAGCPGCFPASSPFRGVVSCRPAVLCKVTPKYKASLGGREGGGEEGDSQRGRAEPWH